MSHSEFRWTFQGGRHRTITIGATAGNVTTNLSPVLGKRWMIIRGRLTLTCDATVAARNIWLQNTDGTNTTNSIGQGAVVAATQTSNLSIGEVNALLTATILDQAYIGINPILLEGADQLRITIGNGVAGDSYSGFIDILEIDV